MQLENGKKKKKKKKKSLAKEKPSLLALGQKEVSGSLGGARSLERKTPKAGNAGIGAASCRGRMDIARV